MKIIQYISINVNNILLIPLPHTHWLRSTYGVNC